MFRSWSKKGVVQFQQLIGYLGSVKEVDDDFKMKFALYILGSFLCPTTKPTVNQSYIHLLSDVRGIENLNWAKITLHFLCQGIRVQRSNGPLAGILFGSCVADRITNSSDKSSSNYLGR